MTLFGVAVAFVAQQADFLAAVQIIVYAGAIVVLSSSSSCSSASTARTRARRAFVAQRPLRSRGVITVGGLIALMAESHWVTGVKSVSTVAPRSPRQANVHQLAPRSLPRTYLPSKPRGAARHRRRRAVLLARRERVLSSEEVDDERTAAGTSCSPPCSLDRAFGLLTSQRLIMFMCVELMLNAVNPHLRDLRAHLSDIGGQATVFFVMVVAAARSRWVWASSWRCSARASTSVDELSELKG